MVAKIKSSNPHDYLAKISLALGLLGLFANFTFVQLNQLFFPVGIIFPLLLALSLGGRAAMTSSVIAIIPVALWSGNIVDGFRLVLSITALGYYFDSKAQYGIHFAYFVLGGLISCLCLPLLSLTELLKSFSFEMTLVCFSALILTNRNLLAQITNHSRPPEFRQVFTNISTAIFTLGFSTGLLLVWYLAPQSVQANFSIFMVALIAAIALVSALAAFLSGVITPLSEQNFSLTEGLRTFSGLSASNWKIQSRLQTEEHDSSGITPDKTASPGLLAVSVSDRIIFANRSLRKLLEISDSDLNGKSLNDLPQGDALKGLCQTARRGQSKTMELKIENGKSLRYLQFVAQPDSESPLSSLNSAPGNVVITVHDVSHKRCLPDSQLQLSKLHSLARSIAGLVHDLNNHLTSVCGLISSARNSTIVNKRNEYLDLALKATNDSARLLRQIMDFAQNNSETTSRFSAHSLLTDSLPLLRQALGPLADITISDQVNASLQGNRDQLVQALVSILGNIRSLYSDSATKRVEIIITREHFDQTMADLIAGGLPGNFIRITIRDFAPQLTASAVRQAFNSLSGADRSPAENFDLSVAYSIIRSHDGFMLLEKNRQEGNSTSLYLPESTATLVAEAQPLAEDSLQQIHCIPHGHGEQLLVVEDDNQVRSVICRMLSGLGYHVKSCSSGQEALALCEQQNFALILTDIMMPNMGGHEFVRELSKQGNSKVLMMTGYVLPENQPGDYHILSKPFDVGKLASSVRAALN